MADVFGLEVKDLFEYDYQKSSDELVDEIITLVKKCPEDKLKLVYRVLKDILGHANLGTTQIYTHVSDTQIKAAIDANPLSEVKSKK